MRLEQPLGSVASRIGSERLSSVAAQVLRLRPVRRGLVYYANRFYIDHRMA